MAQIAIPILLLGTAYLISNEQTDDDDKDKDNHHLFTWSSPAKRPILPCNLAI